MAFFVFYVQEKDPHDISIRYGLAVEKKEVAFMIQILLSAK